MPVRNKRALEAGLLLDDDHLPGSVDARHARDGEPHVAALNAYAAAVAASADERVPCFDPESGGVEARVLLLLDEPRCVAAERSRMISRHNNDATSANTLLACETAGLAYADALHWNVVAWWVRDPLRKQPRSLAGQARRSGTHLAELIGLLPRLDTVVLLGKAAQQAWRVAGLGADDPGADLRVLAAPHPSPLAWHQRDAATGRRNSELTVETLARAAKSA